MGRLKLFFAVLAICLPFAAQAEAVLLMAEEDGCIYCARWNAEVGDAYDKTAEGKAAPLQRYDINAGPPDGVSVARKVLFTPTFILLKDGTEVGRIEGYPGEDFFWGLLGGMLERADVEFGEGKTG